MKNRIWSRPNRRFMLIVLLLIVPFIIAACRAPNEADRKAIQSINQGKLQAPQFVGCLPDGRALFVVELYALRRSVGGSTDSVESNADRDRVYITLDGETSASLRRTSGKTSYQQTIAWPVAQPIPANTVDPCKASGP